MVARVTVIPGDRFNAWTVLEEIAPIVYGGQRGSVSIRRFRCRCDCGEEREISMTNIKKSMGCAVCGMRKRHPIQDEQTVRQIKHALRNLESKRSICRRFNVCLRTVLKIDRGETWSHVTLD